MKRGSPRLVVADRNRAAELVGWPDGQRLGCFLNWRDQMTSEALSGIREPFVVCSLCGAVDWENETAGTCEAGGVSQCWKCLAWIESDSGRVHQPCKWCEDDDMGQGFQLPLF